MPSIGVQVKAVKATHTLAITSSSIPLIPDADRGFSPDPGSHVEEISLLATSEQSSVSHQSGAAEEQPTSNVPLQKELDTIQKPHGNCMFLSVLMLILLARFFAIFCFLVVVKKFSCFVLLFPKKLL